MKDNDQVKTNKIERRYKENTIQILKTQNQNKMKEKEKLEIREFQFDSPVSKEQLYQKLKSNQIMKSVDINIIKKDRFGRMFISGKKINTSINTNSTLKSNKNSNNVVDEEQKISEFKNIE